jgi:tetratricopeptide (TPR) repeat protein
VNHRVHRLDAEVRADSGRHEQALASAMRAAELNPDVPVVWMLVSLEAAILGQVEQSRVALAALRKLDSDPTRLASRAARAYRQDQWTLVPPMVEAFAGEVGWPSQNAHYLGFKSALALYRLERPDEAVVLLDRIAAALPSKSWASSVAAYLKGTLDEGTFVDRAKSLGERTEARAYIGLMAAIKGRRGVATTHLRWVAERGSRTYAEYEMALDELKRLGEGIGSR